MKTRRTVIVKRSEWLRGRGAATSGLLWKNDGLRCCLGFAARECGISDKDAMDRSMPRSLPIEARKVWEAFYEVPPLINTELMDDLFEPLAVVNDDRGLSDAEREARLIELGREVGTEFQFQD